MFDGQQYWHGGALLGTLLEDVPQEIAIDKDGGASTTMHYQCGFSVALQLVSELRRNPMYDWMVLKTATISREEAGMARVIAAFEGIDETEYGFEDEEARVSYSLEGSESSEPIETHIKFKEFAGTYLTDPPINGAQFVKEQGNDQGRFLGFTCIANPEGEGVVPSPKAGTRSFIQGGFIYAQTKTYSGKMVDKVRIDMNRLGKIDAPPKSKILPKVSAGREWLLISCSVVEIGKGMRVIKRWRLSGPKGWDHDIYDYAE